MSFINPLMLGAFSCIIIPPLIYFLINRKKIVLQWAAFEWMKKAGKKKHKQSKINDILKIIAKMLLLLFLVLLLSRPAFQSGNSKKNTLIVIDNTLSMLTKLGNGTRLDATVAIADKISENSKDNFALCTFDGNLNPISDYVSGDNFAVSEENIKASSEKASFSEFSEAFANSRISENADRIIFISDFQKSDYKDTELLNNFIKRYKQRKQMVFIPVDKRTDIKNLSVESVNIASEGIYPFRENSIKAKIHNYSDQALKNIPVSLKVNDKKQDRKHININAGETTEVKLKFYIAEKKQNICSISVPDDSFTEDNVFKFAVSSQEPLKILTLREESKENFQKDIFFKSALSAFLSENAMIYTAVNPYQVFAYDPGRYDLLVTFGVDFPANENLSKLIKRYLSNGGSLIAFSKLENKTNSLEGLGFKTTGLKDKETEPDPDKLKNTYLNFMKKENLNTDLIRFFKYRGIKINSESSRKSEKNSAKLFLKGMSEPLIILSEHGKGKMILCGFMPFLKSTNFFYNPNFVQFTVNMLNSVLTKEFFTYFTGDEIKKIRIPNLKPGGEYFIVSEDGIKNRLGIARDNKGLYLIGKNLISNEKFTVIDGETPIYHSAYNLSRNDSAVMAASEENFSSAVENGLIFGMKDLKSGFMAANELIWLTVILFLGSIILDNYAHFWRKK